ncbi:MAG: hypothetical protein P8017_04055, partial [Deltaproteobacteria bacterium]
LNKVREVAESSSPLLPATMTPIIVAYIQSDETYFSHFEQGRLRYFSCLGIKEKRSLRGNYEQSRNRTLSGGQNKTVWEAVVVY